MDLHDPTDPARASEAADPADRSIGKLHHVGFRASPLGLVSTDVVDLLVSAAVAWCVLPRARPVRVQQAAASPPGEGGVPWTPAGLGRLWLHQNRLAAATRSRPGAVPVPAVVERYEPTPVRALEPIQVVKSCHSLEHVSVHSPSWSTSAARLYLQRLERAAIQRLDGYAGAAWEWTRPTGTPLVIGVVTGTPDLDLPGVRWVTPEQATRLWSDAHLVLVRENAAEALPPDLPHRDGVYYVGTDLSAQTRVLAERVHASIYVSWPTGRPWLLSVLQDPATAPTGTRLYRGGAVAAQA